MTLAAFQKRDYSPEYSRLVRRRYALSCMQIFRCKYVIELNLKAELKKALKLLLDLRLQQEISDKFNLQNCQKWRQTSKKETFASKILLIVLDKICGYCFRVTFYSTKNTFDLLTLF